MSLSLSFNLSVCLSACLSVYPSIFGLSGNQSIYQSINISIYQCIYLFLFIYLNNIQGMSIRLFYLFVHLSIHLYLFSIVHQPVCLFVHLSAFLSNYSSVVLSVHPNICIPPCTSLTASRACLSILSVYPCLFYSLSSCLSVCMFVHLSVHVPTCPLLCLTIYPFVFLSICLYVPHCAQISQPPQTPLVGWHLLEATFSWSDICANDICAMSKYWQPILT